MAKHSSTISRFLRRSMHPKEADSKGGTIAPWMSLVAFPLCIAVGIFVVAQFRSVQKVGGSVSMQRTQELTNRVQTLIEENQGLLEKVQAQQDRLKQYEESFHDTDLVAQKLGDDLRQARMEAGLVDLTGPGIMIELAPRVVAGDEGFVMKNVLDEDLLVVVNELNASAAEAISINGERVIATTEIRNAGNYININTKSCTAPFTIRAIGDPTTLEAALRLRGGVMDTLGEYYDIQITKVESLVVDKYERELQYHYAQPTTESSGVKPEDAKTARGADGLNAETASSAWAGRTERTASGTRAQSSQGAGTAQGSGVQSPEAATGAWTGSAPSNVLPAAAS